MELFTRCDRCGELVGTSSETVCGAAVQCAPCVVMTVRDGSEYTVLCPDCMAKLKSWLTGGPEEPQEASDSAERLAADLVSAVENVTAPGFCKQELACGYFGHSGDINCHVWRLPPYRSECPAYGGDSCSESMLGDIHRRCKDLGIDLKAGKK